MLIVDECRVDYPEFSACYSLTVPSRALCAIVGPSGDGKTTLLHMIAGFERPFSGKLQFDGIDLLPLKPSERPIAMVFQDHNLFPHLSARANVGLGLRPSLHLTDEEHQKVAEALDAVDLRALSDRLPGDMSGGQRQRVALAQALVSRRPLLLLDEPFGGLDPGLRRSMIRLVDDLRRDRRITVVLTIHTPEDIADLADRAAFVVDGRVIAEGTPREILIPARDTRIATFLG